VPGDSHEELALERAAAADKEIGAGHYRGPLHGIPFGVKDLFDTKGILTAWGAEPFQKRIPGRDATVIERLHEAGAILLAKPLHGSFGHGRPCWDQGQTKSPWSWSETSKSFVRGSSGSSAGPGVGHGGGTGCLFPGDGNAGLHRLAKRAVWNGGLAAHLRPRQPVRRHGAELDHG